MARTGMDIASLGFEETAKILATEHREMSPRQIESMLKRNLGGTSLEQMEDFLNVMKDIGNVMVKALPAVLPIVGSAFGPVGTAVGAAAGAVVGGATQAANKKKQPSKPRSQTKPAAKSSVSSNQPSINQPSISATASNSTNSAAQLLNVLMRPEVLQSIMAMMLGKDGTKEIKVGDQNVPVDAFANLLAVMANNMAAQYNTISQPDEESIPNYLMDSNGEFKCDIAVPEQRATALLEILHESTQASPSIVSNNSIYEWEHWKSMVEQEYDELDLEDIYINEEV